MLQKSRRTNYPGGNLALLLLVLYCYYNGE